MNVLFVTRPDAYTRPGGDTVQLEKTKEALEVLGVQVRFGSVEAEALAWTDIVHVFNLQTPETSLPALRMARAAGKKTVLSTIWWDLGHAQQVSTFSRVFGFGVPNPSWLLTLPSYRLLEGFFRERRYSHMRQAIHSADLLLPNSVEEMMCLRRDFGQDLPPHRVVRNAVDTQIFEAVSGTSGHGVICCARIEPIKNQLLLIRAVVGIPGVNLTLIGKGNNDINYNRRVRDEVMKHGYTWIEDHLLQSEIVSLLRKHAVHALPSFRESPGLSTLEALSIGLNAVVSSKPFCPVETYFKKDLNQRVFMCDPYKVKSVRNSLRQALGVGALHGNNLNESFSWDDVAKQTLEAYNEICT